MPRPLFILYFRANPPSMDDEPRTLILLPNLHLLSLGRYQIVPYWFCLGRPESFTRKKFLFSLLSATSSCTLYATVISEATENMQALLTFVLPLFPLLCLCLVFFHTGNGGLFFFSFFTCAKFPFSLHFPLHFRYQIPCAFFFTSLISFDSMFSGPSCNASPESTYPMYATQLNYSLIFLTPPPPSAVLAQKKKSILSYKIKT